MYCLQEGLKMVEDPKRMCQLTSLCVPLVLLYTIIYLLLHLLYNASRDGDWSSMLSADLLFVNIPVPEDDT